MSQTLNRNKYSTEFKLNALNLCKEPDYTTAQAAKKFANNDILTNHWLILKFLSNMRTPDGCRYDELILPYRIFYFTPHEQKLTANN